jgi:hypothetical protein
MNTRTTQFLQVLPNPYLQLDGFGNPAGAFAVDPKHNPDRCYVGAMVANVEVLDSLQKGDTRAPRQDIYWKFELDEVTNIPVTDYYLEALRKGCIFPANADTAKRAGIAFKDKEDYLYEACKKARDAWRQMYMEECPLKQYEKKVVEVKK